MTYNSVLFKNQDGSKDVCTHNPPEFFSDLNLDQIIDAVTTGKDDYNLKPYFFTPLKDTDTILYRHEIMQDLKNETLLRFIRSFAKGMATIRRYQTFMDKLTYPYHKEAWFLKTANLYSKIITQFSEDLLQINLTSEGLRTFRAYLDLYTVSNYFVSLKKKIEDLKSSLANVHYSLFIKDNRIRVQKYRDEADYSRDVEDTFKKFSQYPVKDYTAEFMSNQRMNHIEAAILDMVAKLYPETFLKLDIMSTTYVDFPDKGITTFDREIQFYLAYIEYTARFTSAGLPFCYPQISKKNKEIFCYEGYDLALAQNLVSGGKPVVCNDFSLKGAERIIIVSGPNQGGKTTFARSFGQLHYLAATGLPVPGKKAKLYKYDALFTHFEKAEDMTNLQSKLENDLVRIYTILKKSTPDSIIIMNEIFSSTTLHDSISLGTKILEQISEKDGFCLWVTFIDELSAYNNKTVSMVSTIDPDNPGVRTYRIVRKPADGLAYALSIAEKYNLTYKQLMERLDR